MGYLVHSRLEEWLADHKFLLPLIHSQTGLREDGIDQACLGCSYF